METRPQIKVLEAQEKQLTEVLQKSLSILSAEGANIASSHDIPLIVKNLKTAGLDLAFISGKITELIAEKNNRGLLRFTMGILDPVVTESYLEANTENKLKQEMPLASVRQNPDTAPLPERVRIHDNIAGLLCLWAQSDPDEDTYFEGEEELKRRAIDYNKEWRKMNRVFNSREEELAFEKKMLEEKLYLEKEVFRLIKEGKKQAEQI